MTWAYQGRILGALRPRAPESGGARVPGMHRLTFPVEVFWHVWTAGRPDHLILGDYICFAEIDTGDEQSPWSLGPLVAAGPNAWTLLDGTPRGPELLYFWMDLAPHQVEKLEASRAGRDVRIVLTVQCRATAPAEQFPAFPAESVLVEVPRSAWKDLLHAAGWRPA